LSLLESLTWPEHIKEETLVDQIRKQDSQGCFTIKENPANLNIMGKDGPNIEM
jgi:hypothetical protein